VITINKCKQAYNLLFNGVTDSIGNLQELVILFENQQEIHEKIIKELLFLREIQQKAEEIIISEL
jgi:hypothetical protein